MGELHECLQVLRWHIRLRCICQLLNCCQAAQYAVQEASCPLCYSICIQCEYVKEPEYVPCATLQGCLMVFAAPLVSCHLCTAGGRME